MPEIGRKNIIRDKQTMDNGLLLFVIAKVLSQRKHLESTNDISR